MAFSLQYYNPSIGDDGFLTGDNSASGAYIFRPRADDMDKKQYSKFDKIETFTTSSGIESFGLTYRDDETKQRYTAQLNLFPVSGD